METDEAHGTSKKQLEKGESLKGRVVNNLESIKASKKLVKSFFKEAVVFFAAA